MNDTVSTLFMSVLALFNPFGTATNVNPPAEIRHVENFGLQNFSDEENFSLDGNNISSMSIPLKKNRDVHEINVSHWRTMLINLIDDDVVDFDKDNNFFNFLETIRKHDDYNFFLYQINKEKNVNVKNAVAMFLSQKDYEYISASEENFIVDLLQSDNVLNQEFALNAILLWENVANKDLLKTIHLSNKYLQMDLDEFLRN